MANWLTRSSLSFIILAIAIIPKPCLAESATNPCVGPTALLNIIDRPSASDSACVVVFKKVVVESGYQVQQLKDSQGILQNYPQLELRFGLPADNELFILPSNYFQGPTIDSGFTSTGVGIKHMLGYNAHWLVSVEGEVIVPGGSNSLGNEKVEGIVNAIITYTFNPKFSLTLMIGNDYLSTSRLSGGAAYDSLNAYTSLTYTPYEKINIYGEIYAQSKTDVNEGFGANFDGGILYLIKPGLVVDFSVSQSLSGDLGGFERYVGMGLSFMF